jgi:hypothetical protein
MEHSGRDATTLERSLHHVFLISKTMGHASIYADLDLMVLVQLKCLTSHVFTTRAPGLASIFSKFLYIDFGLR